MFSRTCVGSQVLDKKVSFYFRHCGRCTRAQGKTGSRISLDAKVKDGQCRWRCATCPFEALSNFTHISLKQIP